MLYEQARKLIDEWDETNGESWSDCSDHIAEIMVSFAKAQLEQLLSDIRSIDQIGVSFDRNWNKCRENYHDSDYIRSSDLAALIQDWEAKL